MCNIHLPNSYKYETIEINNIIMYEISLPFINLGDFNSYCTGWDLKTRDALKWKMQLTKERINIKQ